MPGLKVWIAWATSVVSTFVAIQSYAIATRRIPPLTSCLKLWCGVDPVKPWRWLGSGAFTVFFSWLILHVVAGLGPNLKQHGGTP
jgi:hypothetical protein